MLVERKITFSFNDRSKPAWERHVVNTYSNGQIVEQKDLKKFTFQKKTLGKPVNYCNCNLRTAWFQGRPWKMSCQREGNHRTSSTKSTNPVQTKQQLAKHVWMDAFEDHWFQNEELFWGEDKNIKVDTKEAWQFAVLAQELPLVFYIRPKQQRRRKTAVPEYSSRGCCC